MSLLLHGECVIDCDSDFLGNGAIVFLFLLDCNEKSHYMLRLGTWWINFLVAILFFSHDFLLRKNYVAWENGKIWENT